MTAEQFSYWLQGYLEISGAKELNTEQLKIVQDHLQLVFQKVTPSYGSSTITYGPSTGSSGSVGYLGGIVTCQCIKSYFTS